MIHQPKSHEHIDEAGLIVIRRAIDPQLAIFFAGEQMEHLGNTIAFHGLHKVRGAEARVLSIGLSPALLEKSNLFPTSSKVLALLNKNKLSKSDPERTVTINYQPPGATQIFHQDNAVEPIVIVHGSDGGAFDYAVNATSIEEAEHAYQTLELNAGDVVLQSQPRQFHRGRNLSDQPRITAAIGKLVEP